MSFPLREFFRRLIEDVFKRFVGDTGPAPENTAGKTAFGWFGSINHFLLTLHEMLTYPAHAETFTTTPLGAGATYVSPTKDFLRSRLAYFCAMAYSDAPSATGGFAIEQSADGVNWDLVSATDAPAGAGKGLRVAIVARYARVRYVNGPSPQTVFRLGGRYTVS